MNVLMQIRHTGAHSFIKEKDRGIFEQHTCNRQPLLFPSRNHQTSLADRGLVAFGKTHDCVVNACLHCSRFYFIVRGIKSAIPHIVHDIGMEQRRILWNYTNRFPEALYLNVVDVLVIYENPSGRRIVETVQETEDRGLPASGWTNYSHFFARRNREGQVAEDGPIRMIAKVHILKTDRTTFQCKRFCTFFILYKEIMSAKTCDEESLERTLAGAFSV